MTFYYFIINYSYSSFLTFLCFFIGFLQVMAYLETPCLLQKPPEKWDIPCTRAQAGRMEVSWFDRHGWRYTADFTSC